MEIAEQVNQEVIELWKKLFSSDVDVWIPLIYPPLQINGLLYVGLNPSFNQPGFKRILNSTPYANVNIGEFYNWRNLLGFDWKVAIEMEKIAKAKYPFYKKFPEIAKAVGLNWEHIDLFFYRQTSATKFKSIIMPGSGLNEFGKEQLRLSTKLMEATKPKAIIVANAFASKIFHDTFSAKFDDNLGCYNIRIKNRVVPVFFTSMLAGQRALDRFSYERLKWHVKKVCSTLTGENIIEP